MSNAQSKIVIITGASSGIGKSTAHYLAERGYHIFGGVRKESDANKLRAESNGKIEPIILDVTKHDQIKAAVALVQARITAKPTLFALVNNAGITTSGPIEFLDIDELRYLWEVNVIGIVATTQAFMPLLRTAERAQIINISSFGGTIASPFLAPYHASKFAVEAISDAMRMELKPWPQIHVSIIKPASIKTPIWQKALDDFDTLYDRLKPGAHDYYDNTLRTVTKSRREFDEQGESPQIVSEAIYKALTAKQPKTRHLLAFNRLLFIFLRFIPDRWRDRLVMRSLGLR